MSKKSKGEAQKYTVRAGFTFILSNGSSYPAGTVIEVHDENMLEYKNQMYKLEPVTKIVQERIDRTQEAIEAARSSKTKCCSNCRYFERHQIASFDEHTDTGRCEIDENTHNHYDTCDGFKKRT